MQLYQYSILNHCDQVDILCRQGIRLGSRSDADYTITLYQIDGFYVEVYYHCKKRHVTHIRPFSTTDLLDAYLEDIDISGLMLR